MRFGFVYGYNDEHKGAVVQCNGCGQTFLIKMTKEQYDRVMDGKEAIQAVLPDHTPGERELFLSGLCDDCFNELF